MSSTLRNAALGVVIALIAALLVTMGFLVRLATEPAATASAPPAATPVASAPAGVDASVDWAILAEIAAILASDFVEPARADGVILQEGAIRGIFEALGDPHSLYIDPDTYSLSRDEFEGAFQGIGATVSTQGEFVVIVRPLPGTPAEAAGIQPGDIILEVDGESAIGWSVEQAVLRIRGPMGTAVELKIRRGDGVEETYLIERAEIQVSSTDVAPPGGVLRDGDGELVEDFAYIRIRSFSRNTPQELTDLIRDAEANGARGIILDLRGNPGGLLGETVEIADMFLDGGLILIQVERSGTERIAEARAGTVTQLPVVIVQDEFSASGAELLAAALQDHGRATIVGAPSFGKGTVNHARELSNGGAVYVSIARWLTPQRNQIEGRGVIPDIEVRLTLEDIEANRDVAVIQAIEVLRAETQ